MPVLETDAERARNRLQSAARIFYIMAVVKVLELLGSLRPPLPDQGAAAGGPRDLVLVSLFGYYTLAILLCVIIGRNLEKKRIWARNLGLVFGAIHVTAFFAIKVFGPMVIISGVLGIIGFFSILVAAGLGAFEEEP